MPTALTPGQDAGCTPLIVVFSIRAGAAGFPPGVQARSVTLSKPGAAAWTRAVSSAETGLKPRWVSDDNWLRIQGSADGGPPPGTQPEQVLAGVARGCATAHFREGDLLALEVALIADGRVDSVRSELTLGSAY